jgi:hypothetical protein
MTSKCGFAFFFSCVIFRVMRMLAELSAKWRYEIAVTDTNLYNLYSECVPHKFNKTSGEELIKAKLKAICNDVAFTPEQDAKLSEYIKAGWEAFIAETPVHYCGDERCDGRCGAQPCGQCIDRCRCYYKRPLP